jgi:hypothetical protein
LDIVAEADATKCSNIIDMAITFTAMNRVFEKKSKAAITAQLAHTLDKLLGVKDTHSFERVHREFCEWFTKHVRTAARTLKNKKPKHSQAASYGHGAKVLDIVAKVYVYYCRLPDAATADALTPLLHGAVDTPILSQLRERYPGQVTATTIETIGQADYQNLQKLIADHIRDEFKNSIRPVQYDDVMWRRLNR